MDYRLLLKELLKSELPGAYKAIIRNILREIEGGRDIYEEIYCKTSVKSDC